MKTFILKLKWQKNITANIKHLAFEREDGEPLTFTPGQFITFLFESEQGVKRRSYSIASIPDKTNEIEIAVSYVKGGIASEIFANLLPRETLVSSGPFGRLTFREGEAPKRYFLVATGTGVAPYRSMLPDIKRRLNKDENLNVILLLGMQYRQDLPYLQDFLDFAAKNKRFEFRAYLSRDTLEAAQPYEYKGYVQSAFPEFNLDPDEDIIYLCGNPNMIDDAFAWLTDEGFSPRMVRREKYISSN